MLVSVFITITFVVVGTTTILGGKYGGDLA